MEWKANPYSVALLVTAFISAVVAVYAWRRRAIQGAIPLFLLMIGVAEWSIGYAIELGDVDLPSKLFWAKSQYFGIVLVPVAWFLFAFQYTSPESKQKRWHWLVLGIIPALTLIAVTTNDAYELIWSQILIVAKGVTSMLIFEYGPWFWIHTLYSYILVFSGTVLIIRFYIRSHGLYRKQARAVLIGAFVPWISNAIYIFRLTPFPGLDLTPFGFAITGLFFAWGFLRLQLFEIIPLARDAVMESMREAVIVLDVNNRIVDFNPEAQKIVKRKLSETIGLPVGQVLSDHIDVLRRYTDVHEADEVISLGDSTSPSYYSLRISPLYDHPGNFIGRLVVLQNITEQHRAKVALERSHEELEYRVQERTLELENVNENLRLEIAERMSFEEALRHRIGMEALVARISTNFINLSIVEIDEEINRALESIGEYAKVDRCYLFRLSADGSTMDNTHEWCAEGILPQISNLKGIQSATVPWWMGKLTRREVIHIPSVAELPAEASAEKAILEAQDIRSLVVVPLFSRKSLIGFLGFDSVRQEKIWDERDINLLRLLGEIFTNTLAREQFVEALQTSEAELRAVFAAMEDSVLLCDRNGEYLEFAPTNPASAFKPADQLVGKTLSEIFPKQTARLLLEKIELALDSQQTIHLDYRVEFDGQQVWFAGAISPVDRDRVVMVARDITDRKASEEQLVYKALHDALTGLPNRRLLVERLERAFERMKRNPEALVGVLFIDLDSFKVINDSLGHTSGDKFLIEIALRLKGCVRGSDTVARLGGDEFALLLENLKDVREAIQISDRVLQDLSVPIEIAGHQVFTSASIGIAFASNNHMHPDEVLRDADAAMYQAKAKGKGRHEIFAADMHKYNLALLKLQADLRRAVDLQELQVYYQPVLDLNSGEIISVEALLRWQHPERGVLMPDDFLSLAEETRLIVPIGEWVMRTACSQAKSWHEAGFSNLRVAVNTSAQQFKEFQLANLVPAVLNESGLEAEFLELEVTEQSAMSDVDLTIQTLDRLSRIGVQISIDDFGKGYSSLNYLKIFPTSTLKIDRSFIGDILDSQYGASIASAIITMAHTLGLNVTAEGVENRQQLDFLVSQKCDQIQGFLISPAIPADDLTGLLWAGNLFKEIPDLA